MTACQIGLQPESTRSRPTTTRQRRWHEAVHGSAAPPELVEETLVLVTSEAAYRPEATRRVAVQRRAITLQYGSS